jgi:hypothetical protein
LVGAGVGCVCSLHNTLHTALVEHEATRCKLIKLKTRSQTELHFGFMGDRLVCRILVSRILRLNTQSFVENLSSNCCRISTTISKLGLQNMLEFANQQITC